MILLLKKLHLSAFKIARADETKERFCEAESVITPYLNVVANLLNGG